MKKTITAIVLIVTLCIALSEVNAGTLIRITNDNNNYWGPTLTSKGHLYFERDEEDERPILMYWNGQKIITVQGNVDYTPERNLIDGESIIYLVFPDPEESYTDLYLFDGTKSTKINPLNITDVSRPTMNKTYIAFAGYVEAEGTYQIFLYKRK